MKIYLASLSLLAFLSATHVGAADAKGWTAQRCGAYGNGYCRVPFVVALTNAERLAALDSGVQVRGYLVKEDEGYALYEDRDAAQRGWRSDAILIKIPEGDEIAKSLVKRNQSNVVVQGRLSLANANDEYWVQLVADKPVLIAAVVGEKLKK
jgi:hypothetical protein